MTSKNPGVTFYPDKTLLGKIDALAGKRDRSRNWMINKMLESEADRLEKMERKQ